MSIQSPGVDTEVEKEIINSSTADLHDVLEACRNNFISQIELMSVLVDNVDHYGLLEILIEEFGVNHARRLMMKTMRMAKKQARERRLNLIK